MMRPEESLLIKLCRLTFSEKTIAEIGDIIEKITDWSCFFSLANNHGVVALTIYNLDRLKYIGKMPEENVIIFKKQLLQNMRDNVYKTSVLAKALITLNEADIKTVLLKGMALELTVYGNKGLRQMSDVDVLMTKEDCLKARDILLKEDFVSDPVKSSFHKKIITEYGKHLPTLRIDEFALELHHVLLSDKDNGFTKQVYETATSHLVNGIEKAYIPSPQLLFVYLVHHLSNHEQNNESQLRLYTDLVVMLEHYEDKILNHSLMEISDSLGLSKEMATKLFILQKYWDIRYSDAIEGFIKKNVDSRCDETFLFFLGSPKNKKRSDAATYRNKIANIPGFSNKLLYVLGDIFPSLLFMKKRYNCGALMAILHYPCRLGKLFYLIGNYNEKEK